MEPVAQDHIFLIEVANIRPNPQQPRRDFDEDSLRELASSIREFGILQPLTVSKIEQETEVGTQVLYELIAGERRLRAAKLAGLERVPAIIRNVALDKERLELAIIENIQRVDLNPVEAARAYARLQDQFGLTQREIAARVGKSRETIANTIRLLGLTAQMQDSLAKGDISESQARLLLSVADIATQQALFEDLLLRGLSVRELKARIQKVRPVTTDAEESVRSASLIDPETVMVQRELEEFLGARVKVEKMGATGKITINFYSPEELEGIIQKLLEKSSAESDRSEFHSPSASDFI
ncbi:MAG: hypothetical protein COU07_02420 [Candidatus Harrisonbacteria bacterium CG10_big_fil_rev_8_21_14_0_10_40_38]|uniref:ParB-like N-terminal domain-containing protein n=1 Tax=Candidatus Harrisonbacteria bacterium CG10_big_fil_rev_8_21_14_0_10_40_38 TaxID=1974583 RepID=A0A2H0URY3_9BACT|nr:MAG: hypothetical protein COU07_02420 [Candidatus Harrisonbacteria bacterium CG10_big_fil_rev_8_21_14_0_10_40_38]